MSTLLITYIAYGACVGVLACLISESRLFAGTRKKLNLDLLYCPICLGFWLALPALLYHGPITYFTTIAFSNLWMLIILRTYRELDEASE